MDDAQLLILRHALGIGDEGRGAAYRNHFVTGPGSKDYDSCMALVARRHMIRRDGNALSGGDYVFHVTDQGRTAARPIAPERPLTRSQRRYLAFLDADCGLSFGEWLRSEGRRA